jgi:hypothetical protein
MDKRLLVALILSVAFIVPAFLGGQPPSARGFYYVIWLAFTGLLWKNRERLESWLKSRNLPEFPLFLGLGLGMIIVEETIAGIVVNLLRVKSIGELLAAVPQYYANNLLLLPGFIIAWYLLLKRYAYSRAEVFALVGLFGIFSEKIYLYVLTIPIMGIPLLLPTMFTYIGIILPSLLSLRSPGARKWNRPARYLAGLVFPVIVSIPFILIHTLLTNAGFIDPQVLTR